MPFMSFRHLVSMNTLSSIVHKWTSTSLMLRIFIGMVVGALMGLFVPQCTFVSILGVLFVSALKAIAPILVFILIVASVAKAKGRLGSRFRTVVSRYLLSSFIAALLAVAGSFIFPVTLHMTDVSTEHTPISLGDVFTNLFTNMVSNPQSILNLVMNYL